MNKLFSFVAFFIIAAVIAANALFVVEQHRFAVVFTLGEVKHVIRQPGLYAKWPFLQNVIYFDNRILTIDTPEAERFQTSEKRNLLVDSFVKWRIADPRLYYVSFQGSEASAQQRMNPVIRDAISNAISRRTVNDVTSRERDKIMTEITAAVAASVKPLGVEIIDVRLKRVDFVPEISDSVYRRMEAERRRVANEQRATGAADGEKIRADADKQREILIAEAYSAAQKKKGEGDAKAAAIYADSFGSNPEFAAFYRSLEAYKSTFTQKSGNLMVLDPSSDFFRYMRQPSNNAGPRK